MEEALQTKMIIKKD